MIYFLNKNLNNNKNLLIELKKIYGLNTKNIKNIFNILGLNSTIKTKKLKKKNELLKQILVSYSIESDLKEYFIKKKKFNIEIKKIKTLKLIKKC